MKVLVIGGTRGTGREVVAAAHAAGHVVTLLARHAERISLPVTGVRVVAGDAGDADDVERAVAGQDAVVWTVGVAPTRRPVHLFSRSTQFVLAAMARHRVRRLICVTGIGAGDSRGHGGFVYDRIVQPLLMKTIYEDKDRQEALLRAADVDWTIVRPGTLTRGPATGLARALTDLAGVTAGRVSRADVAAFIVENLDSAAYRKTTVLLTS